MKAIIYENGGTRVGEVTAAFEVDVDMPTEYRDAFMELVEAAQHQMVVETDPGDEIPEDAVAPPELVVEAGTREGFRFLEAFVPTVLPYQVELVDVQVDLDETPETTPHDELMDATGMTPHARKEKDWEPYEGPQGGQGWRNPATDEIRYQESKPSESSGESEAATPEVTVDLPNANTFEAATVGDTIRVDAQDWQGQLVVTDLSHDADGDLRALYGHPVGDPTEEYAVNRAVFDGIAERGTASIDTETGDIEWVGETGLPVPESPATIDDEWKHANLFPGQRVYIENGRKEVVGEVVEVHTSSGMIHDAEVKLPGEKHPVRFTKLVEGENFWDYEVAALEDWDSLSDDRKYEGLMQQFDDGTAFDSIPKATKETFRTQLRENVMPSLKSFDHARNLVASFFLLRDYADRANVGRNGTGFRMQISEGAPESTTHHEFGHGLAGAYGYDFYQYDPYEKDDTWSVKWYRRPGNVAHKWRDIRVEYGGIPFDFEATKWYAPEVYQFRDITVTTRAPETLEIGETYGGSGSSIMASSITPTDITQRDDGTYVIEVEEYRLPVFMNEDGEILDYEYGFTDWDDYMESQSFPPKPMTNETVRVETETGEWEAVVDRVSGYSTKRVHFEDAPHGKAELHPDGTLTFPDDSTGRIQAVQEKLNVSPDIEFTQPAVGYAEWREDVHAELEDTQYFGLDQFDYTDPIPAGEGTYEAFETLDDGDVVHFETIEKEWVDGDQVEVEKDRYLRFIGPVDETDEMVTYEFETEDGGYWRWSVYTDDRGLKTSTGSEAVAIARQPPIEAGQDYSAEAENPDHPLARWQGFDTTPETPADDIRNLVSAANRAWYKQAKTCERDPDGSSATRRNIGSFYSTTNAHETMAKMTEVMQSPENHTKYDYEMLAGEHPSLVTAYLEVYTVPEKTREYLVEAGWETIE